MAMTAAEIKQASRDFVRKAFVEANATANLTSVEVEALIADLDAYLDANAIAINLAIRASVRSKASTPQKALGMAYCALRRAGVV